MHSHHSELNPPAALQLKHPAAPVWTTGRWIDVGTFPQFMTIGLEGKNDNTQRTLRAWTHIPLEA